MIEFYLDFGKEFCRLLFVKSNWLICAVLMGLNCTAGLWADAAGEISEFSVFEKAALQKIKPSEVLSAKGSLMKFERGISSETCFLAPHSPEKVLERLYTWDQTPYPDLGVIIQGPSTEGSTLDFSKLNFNGSLRPVAKFLEKNKDTRVGDSPLHISQSEATLISQKGGDAKEMNRIWSEILSGRLSAYQGGGVKSLPPYDASKPKVEVENELHALLAEKSTISKRFEALFSKIESNPTSGRNYWQMMGVDGTAALILGTIYTHQLPNGVVQVVDFQWFVTGGYYLAFTCYELHPLELGKSGATLVWRGDYTSISNKQLRKGVERLFSVNIMIQEVKKSIRFFLEDLNKK